MSDWWSRKLGNQPAAPRQSLPPVQTPLRFPVQNTPAQQGRQFDTSGKLLDPSQGPTAEITMGDALHLWKGGEAHRAEGGSKCPSCGSGLIFGRVKNNTVMGKQPAPRCFECGWNGLYDQGEQANWAV